MNRSDIEALKAEVEFTASLLTTVRAMGREIIELHKRVERLEKALEAAAKQGLIDLDQHPRSEEISKH